VRTPVDQGAVMSSSEECLVVEVQFEIVKDAQAYTKKILHSPLKSFSADLWFLSPERPTRFFRQP
jgi:hypothetical protein